MFRILFIGQKALGKSYVPASFGYFQVEVGVSFGFRYREAGLGKERIILGIYHQGRDADMGKKLLGTAAGLIFRGIFKAVYRGGIAVIKIREGPQLLVACQVQVIGKILGFKDQFPFQGFEEAAQVDAVFRPG